MKRSDMERLCADGLISDAQLGRILEHYHLAGNRNMQWLTLCLSCMAGVLVIGGAIMLVSANWHSIPPAMKMGGGIGLMVASWILYACFRHRHPVLAEGLGLVGGGFWLANIALYGQIFQLQNPAVEGMFLFLAGIVLVPVLVPQRIMIGVVAVGSCLLLGLALETSPQESWLGLRNALGEGCPVALLWALLLFWWLLAERWRTCQGWWRSYAWVGVLALIVLLTMAQFWLQYMPSICKGDSLSFWLLMAAVPVLMLLLRPRVPWKPWLVLALATSCLMPVTVGISYGEEWVSMDIPHLERGVGIGVMFVYSLVLMFCGARCNRRLWVNAGCLGVIFAWVALMADVLQSYTNSGFALLGGGIFLFALVAILGRQRHRLLRQMETLQDKVDVQP